LITLITVWIVILVGIGMGVAIYRIYIVKHS
jgi:hypothetical protein